VRLLIAAPSAERVGGAQSILFSFLSALGDRGVEPHVVFLSRGGLADDVAALGIPTETVPAARLGRGGSFVRVVPRLRSLIARERPDLVLGWGPKPQIYLSPACLLAGAGDRCVWRATELPGAAVHRLALTLSAKAIVCASRFVAAAHERAGKRRVVVAQPGLLEPPGLGEAEGARVRSEFAIPEGAAVLGTVGRLVPVKQHDRFLQLVAALRGAGRPVHGLIVGGDVRGFAPGHEQELRDLAAELGIADAVTFTGHVLEVGSYLAAMDVFVSVVSDEGFGAAVVEALAAAVPVVALDAGGPAEILADGESGMLVPDGDADALREAVAEALDDPALLERLSRAGRLRYERAFTAEAGAERLIDVLEDLSGSP